MKSIFSILFAFLVVAMACSCMSCKSSRKSATEPDTVALVGPTFCADSAYAFCAKQCSFGPRLMNTEAHDKCGEWIMKQFAGYGLKVETQDAELKAWDGTMLRSRNIWARFRPELTTRVLLCAHWDCRPWADNDPDSTNWRKPVMGANDGASGVAVMLELARIISSDSTLNIGVDFVCFDAEDYGVPQWLRLVLPHAGRRHDNRRPRARQREGWYSLHRHHTVLSRLPAELVRPHMAHHQRHNGAHRPRHTQGCRTDNGADIVLGKVIYKYV